MWFLSVLARWKNVAEDFELEFVRQTFPPACEGVSEVGRWSNVDDDTDPPRKIGVFAYIRMC